MFARTERLLLRPSWPEDAESLHRAIGDYDIIRNLAQAPWPYTMGDARDFVNAAHGAVHPQFLLMRRTGGNPELIGGCGLVGSAPDTQSGGTSAEIGYWIARPYWGLGYASEAARALVDIARAMGYRHLVAEHFTDNSASRRVLEKAGFTNTGKIRMRHGKARGNASPCAVYGRRLTKDDDAAIPAGMRRSVLIPYDAQLIAE